MRRYIAFTVFFSGMTALAAEFGASRLLQMRFGSVNLVWAVIIGLILIYFAAGYFIGGKQADKSPRPESMFTFLAWGGAMLGLTPIIAQPILLAAASAMDALNLGVIAASFIATLLLCTNSTETKNRTSEKRRMLFTSLASAAASLFSITLVENLFTQANMIGRHFNELVIIDEL